MIFKFGKKNKDLENNQGQITLSSISKHTPFNERYFEILGLVHTGIKGDRGTPKEDTLGVTGKYINFDISRSINDNLISIVNEQGIAQRKMRTSPILSYQEKYGNIFLETKNTIYALQDVTKEITANRENSISLEK